MMAMRKQKRDTPMKSTIFALCALVALIASSAAVKAVVTPPDNSITVESPNRHAISNVIVYFDEPDGVKRVKFDGVTGEIHCIQFDFSSTDYAFSTIIGYSVKAGNNRGGPNGEGQYVDTNGPQPNSWAEFVEMEYSTTLADGIATPCDGDGDNGGNGDDDGDDDDDDGDDDDGDDDGGEDGDGEDDEDDDGDDDDGDGEDDEDEDGEEDGEDENAAGISGQVRLDLDGDGDLSDDEEGRAGIDVELWTDPNNDGDPSDGNLVAEAVTDADGTYQFDDLAAGTYVVLENDPSDDFQSTNDADGGFDEDSWNSILVVLEAGQHVADRDFLDEPFATGTLAFIINVKTLDGADGRVVEWTTGAEAGTVGFLLHGVDPETRQLVQLNSSLLATAGEPSGGIYRVRDERPSVKQSDEYIIEEVEDDGNVRRYGPFHAEATNGDAKWLGARARPTDAAPVPLTRSGVTTKTGDFLNLFVGESGVYHVSAARIGAGLGWTEEQTRQAILNAAVRLRHRGRSVDYLPSADGEGLYFYAADSDSTYARRDIYTVSAGRGSHMDSVSGVPVDDAKDRGTSFVDVLRIEEDRKPIPHAVADVDDGLWVWTKLVASEGRSGAEDFSFVMDAPATDGDAALLLHLHGGSEAKADPDQRVDVELNGTSIGTASWDGKVRHTAEFTFDAELLTEGDNTLTLTARLPDGVKHSMTYVDAFDLIFPRSYGVRGGQAEFFADDNDVISLGGFQSDTVRIIDITRPLHPVQITQAAIVADREGGYRATFAPADPRSHYAAFTPESALAAEGSEPGRTTMLSAPSNAADYVIITVPQWASTVQPLADWRSAEGLETKIVTTDQIYNEFGHGEPNPQLIRQFLGIAHRRWATAPSYVLLVGNGTYDYRGATGADDNRIPAAMTRTEEGLRPSDMILGDVVGNDAVAEISVGRLPAVSADEVADMIDKIIAYETAADENWSSDAILAAGQTDAAGDFQSTVETLGATVFAERRTTSIRLDGDSESEREALIDGMNRGSRLVGYVGHGGFDQLADGDLFTAADVDPLENGEALPIVVAATCHAGNFAEAGRTSLAEALMLRKNGGAAAVWAPTGLSYNANSAALLQAFCAAAFDGGAVRLGDAVRMATRNWLEEAGSEEYRRAACRTFALIGDPALNLRMK